MESMVIESPLSAVFQARKKKGKPVILCVDDERAVVETLEQQVRRAVGKDFAIEVCESGEEAMEVIQELYNSGKDLAIIISDQIMPGMKGDEVLIKTHSFYPRSKKIMLTGQASLEDVARVINKANLFRYIPKPWEATDFQLTITEAAKSYFYELTIEEQNHYLKSIYQVANLWFSRKDIDLVLKDLAQIMTNLGQCDRVLIFTVEGDEILLRVESTPRDTRVITDAKPLKAYSDSELPREWIQKCVETKSKLVHQHASDVIPYFKENEVASAIAIPLVNILGNVLGCLYFEKKHLEAYFSRELEEVIDILTSISAIALDNALLHDSLEKLVLEQSRTLVASDSQKDEIIRIVSHDIRSPLTGIVNLSQLFQEDSIASDPERIKEYGAIIQQSARTILSLVNDILDLSRLESGKIILHKDSTNAYDLLNTLVETFLPNAITKEIKIIQDYESLKDVTLNVDKTKILQALGNFVANALKFTPKGGEIRIKGQLKGDKVEIRIEDTGIGIEKDQIPKIFEKFSSHQRSGTGGEKGTGLGLSIAKELITIHGGTIDVESEVGKGTSFIITLPRT